MTVEFSRPDAAYPRRDRYEASDAANSDVVVRDCFGRLSGHGRSKLAAPWRCGYSTEAGPAVRSCIRSRIRVRPSMAARPRDYETPLADPACARWFGSNDNANRWWKPQPAAVAGYCADRRPSGRRQPPAGPDRRRRQRRPRRQPRRLRRSKAVKCRLNCLTPRDLGTSWPWCERRCLRGLFSAAPSVIIGVWCTPKDPADVAVSFPDRRKLP